MAKEKDDVFQTTGTVQEASNGIFKVKTVEGAVVQCTAAGRMRKNNINVLVGDSVRLDVSAYDPRRGRITFRSKG